MKHEVVVFDRENKEFHRVERDSAVYCFNLVQMFVRNMTGNPKYKGFTVVRMNDGKVMTMTTI